MEERASSRPVPEPRERRLGVPANSGPGWGRGWPPYTLSSEPRRGVRGRREMTREPGSGGWVQKRAGDSHAETF